MTGAGVVFFAYIGFDAVSTAAQEAKNPQRDMPIGIIGSLLICTVLYIVVSAIATGVVPYRELDVPDPIALAADRAGLGWMATLDQAGRHRRIVIGHPGHVAGPVAGVLDHVERRAAAAEFVNKIHPEVPDAVDHFHRHRRSQLRFRPALLTVREAGSLVSIGTLLAFVIVSIGILVLRVREPNLPRMFKTPAVWFVAPAGAHLGTVSDGVTAVAHLGAAADLVGYRVGNVLRVRVPPLEAGPTRVINSGNKSARVDRLSPVHPFFVGEPLAVSLPFVILLHAPSQNQDQGPP